MTQSEASQILEELKEIRTRLDHLERSVEKSEAYRQGTQ